MRGKRFFGAIIACAMTISILPATMAMAENETGGKIYYSEDFENVTDGNAWSQAEGYPWSATESTSGLPREGKMFGTWASANGKFVIDEISGSKALKVTTGAIDAYPLRLTSGTGKYEMTLDIMALDGTDTTKYGSTRFPMGGVTVNNWPYANVTFGKATGTTKATEFFITDNKCIVEANKFVHLRVIYDCENRTVTMSAYQNDVQLVKNVKLDMDSNFTKESCKLIWGEAINSNGEKLQFALDNIVLKDYVFDGIYYSENFEGVTDGNTWSQEEGYPWSATESTSGLPREGKMFGTWASTTGRFAIKDLEGSKALTVSGGIDAYPLRLTPGTGKYEMTLDIMALDGTDTTKYGSTRFPMGGVAVNNWPYANVTFGKATGTTKATEFFITDNKCIVEANKFVHLNVIYDCVNRTVTMSAYQNGTPLVEDVKLNMDSAFTKENCKLIWGESIAANYEQLQFAIDNVVLKDYVPTYDIVNLVAASTNETGKAVVSFTNPRNDDITSIKVYVNDVEQAIEANLDSKAFNEIVLTRLTINTSYNIKVVTVVGGETKTYETNFTTDKGGETNTFMNNWTTYRREDNGYTNSIAVLDKDIKASGESSARIDGNMIKMKGNTYYGIQQKIQNLAPTSVYRVVFKTKTEKVSHVMAIFDAKPFDFGDEGTNWQQKDAINVLTTQDWTEYSFDFDNVTNAMGDSSDSYSACLLLATDALQGSVWFDDVAVYDITNDETMTNNLLINGGFEEEYVITAPVMTLSNQTITKLATGDVTFKSTVTNNTNEEDFDVKMIVALYDGDKLVNVALADKAATDDSKVNNYSATITIPELTSGNYKVNVMYWDSLEMMRPYIPAVPFTE